jgi:hypothetical protein
VVVWAVAVAGVVRSAYRDVQSGLAATDHARAGADAQSVVEGRMAPDLGRARDDFQKARRQLDGPLLYPVRLLPVAGRQLRSVSDLSSAAAKATALARGATMKAHRILDQPEPTTAARLKATRQLGELAGQVSARLRSLDLGPRDGLVAPVARARNRLATRLAEVRDALDKGAQGGAAVADLLTGPRRYLLFAANNAEMRAGSGMFLSAGELETGPDGINLADMRSVTDIPVPPDAVPLSGDLADRWGWLKPNVDWRNLMTSPRFDASAPLAAQMWVASGHRPVDGVMSLDPTAMAGILSATGPVEVDGRQITADNVEGELMHDQYLRFSDPDSPERREELGRLAHAVFAALDDGQWSVSHLAAGLASAAGGRHLLMWSARPTEQAAWRSLDVDGSLRPESMLLSVLNRGGNKLDRFLSVSADVKVAAVGNETEVTLTLQLENRVPEGEPTYIAGPEPSSGLREGDYLGIVTVDLPASARGGSFDGVEHLAVAGADGPSQVMGFELSLERGAQRSVVARFRLPGRRGSLRVEPTARIPPVRWSSGSLNWSDAHARGLTWGP